ncbi:MAG: uroporphyrinogen decarboxylase family protein [Phycisphaerae bacterium]|nr:uroporphyrinogen decarboxylase family protein [Phycisphaerae bacterium]
MDKPPLLPILHSALAPMMDISLGEYFTRAETMSDVIVGGYRRFGYDGVQLSQGVTAEAEALGASVRQPSDAGPILREYLLEDYGNLGELSRVNPCTGGRVPMFYQAVENVMSAVGDEAFVLPTLRGPLLTATQLRGIERVLIDMLDDPKALCDLLDFTTNVALRLGRELVKVCNHGLLLGEAPCSPDMISPAMYREFILPRHRTLIAELRAAGWESIGLHICGDTRAIFEEVIASGADFLDVDHKVPAREACALAADRIVLCGNLDPSSVFRFGAKEKVASETEALCRDVSAGRWILGSGCDIPPGTDESNVATFVKIARAAG